MYARPRAGINRHLIDLLKETREVKHSNQDSAGRDPQWGCELAVCGGPVDMIRSRCINSACQALGPVSRQPALGAGPYTPRPSFPCFMEGGLGEAVGGLEGGPLWTVD